MLVGIDCEGDRYAFHDDGPGRSRPGRKDDGQNDGVQQKSSESGRIARDRWAVSPFDGSAGYLHRRQSHGYGWAFRRSEGGDRRLLDHSGEFAGRGDPMGHASADVQQGDH